MSESTTTTNEVSDTRQLWKRAAITIAIIGIIVGVSVFLFVSSDAPAPSDSTDYSETPVCDDH